MFYNIIKNQKALAAKKESCMNIMDKTVAYSWLPTKFPLIHIIWEWLLPSKIHSEPSLLRSTQLRTLLLYPNLFGASFCTTSQGVSPLNLSLRHPPTWTENRMCFLFSPRQLAKWTIFGNLLCHSDSWRCWWCSS